MYNISPTLGLNILESMQRNFIKLSGMLKHDKHKLPSKFQPVTPTNTRDITP